jgi:hypothetical protein
MQNGGRRSNAADANNANDAKLGIYARIPLSIKCSKDQLMNDAVEQDR